MIDRYRHVLFAVVIVSVLIGLRLLLTGPGEMDDLRSFETATGSEIGPEAAFFAAGLDGDGATFTIVALDPLGRRIGHLLNDPSYRYMRFGFPWLATGVVAGHEDLVLLGLTVVGMAAAGLVAFTASRLNETRGLWAWLLVANPALVLGALNDTAEPLAIALLALAIMTGSMWAAVLLAAVRPTFLIAIAGRWRILAVAFAVAATSKVYWSWHFEESFLTGGSNLDLPFAGVVASPTILGWMLMAAAVVTAVIGGVKRDWAWVVSGVFVLCFGQVVVDTPINALRAAAFLPVLWAFGPNFDSRLTLREVFTTSPGKAGVGPPRP